MNSSRHQIRIDSLDDIIKNIYNFKEAKNEFYSIDEIENAYFNPVLKNKLLKAVETMMKNEEKKYKNKKK